MRILGLLAIVSVWCLATSPSDAADDFDRPPIEYSTAAPDNPVATLQAQLEAGTAQLKHSDQHGYLDSLLHSLDIPVESQTLVFSQTSLQRNRISPRTPRAIYFNDDVYVGYCASGEMLEVSTADRQLGAVFYTLDQHPADLPKLVRQTDRCLQCHESPRTDDVPGHLVRSLFVSKSGQPIFSGGSHSVDHTTPFEHRWGGWYVTGTHGAQTHLGNLVIDGDEVPAVIDKSASQNLTRLPDGVATEEYLSAHSDIVALMVLEHQTFVHNRITHAGYAARQALYADSEFRRILGGNAGQLRDSTVRRIGNAADGLVEALLFVKEAKLTDPVQGTSGFAESFCNRANRDEEGRSLRDFDLTTRLFEYPCSYLIDSRSFQELPRELRDTVWTRLWSVLVDGADPAKFSHLSAADRQAIVEIIVATQPQAPERWRAMSKRDAAAAE